MAEVNIVIIKRRSRWDFLEIDNKRKFGSERPCGWKRHEGIWESFSRSGYDTENEGSIFRSF